MANRAAEVFLFNISDKEKLIRIGSLWEDMKIEYIVLNNDLTQKEALDLGLKKWDSESSLFLLPLWLCLCLSPGTEVISVDGEKDMLCNVDKDIRYGCIAWGFELEE